MNIDNIMSMLGIYNPTMLEYDRIREYLEVLEEESYTKGYGAGFEKCSENYNRFNTLTYGKKSDMDGYEMDGYA